MSSVRSAAVTAFGASTATLLYMMAPLASPGRRELFHLDGPIRAVLVPVLFDFALIWLFLLVLLLCVRRFHRAFLWLQFAVSTGVVWKLIATWFALHSRVAPLQLRFTFAGFVAAGLLYLLTRERRQSMLLVRAAHAGTVLVAFVALSGVVTLLEMFLFCFEARHLNDPVAFHQPMPQAHPHSRIVWVVFDELSYRQLYEHRYAGVELPAFDRLAAQATVFSDARPAGNETEIVLPSYLTGRRIEQVTPALSMRSVLLRDSSNHRQRPLDGHDTVFQDALQAGMQTGLAGWFNPYCRLIPGVLDHCFWSNGNTMPGGMYGSRPILWNAVQPFLTRLHLESLDQTMLDQKAHASPAGSGNSDVSETILSHQQDYFSLSNAGDAMLGDPAINFLLLHMPIPHPGGIYNRRTKSFAVDRPSYLDNLALCDAYLAHLREVLEQKGAWDETTLVITGDHSWRVNTLWASAPGWTAEEQRASDGARFDDRPGYIVKLPGQHTAYRDDAPFDTVRTRSLFQALISGKIQTTEQLVAWAR